MENKRDKDLRQIMKSERSRGTGRQRNVESVESEEAIREIFLRFADPDCSRERFLEAIQGLGQKAESKLVRNLLKAFDDRHN